MKHKVQIEVAYATPEKQVILEYEIDSKATPRDAIRSSGIKTHFAEIDLKKCALGVFGKVITDEYQLSNGDRIEIYRPLIADPKEVRRQRAAKGLKTGKGGGKLKPS